MAAALPFRQYTVEKLQGFLKERGIPLSEGGKRKKKDELILLCENANKMKQQKIDPSFESDLPQVIEAKLRIDKDFCLPNPKNITTWTYNFSEIPEFTFGQLYSYFIGKDEYTEESLRAFKSLTGFKLYQDGHVVKLQFYAVPKSNYSLFKFEVKPTDKKKTDEGLSTYGGFFVLEENADVRSAYCQCKAGVDGYLVVNMSPLRCLTSKQPCVII